MCSFKKWCLLALCFFSLSVLAESAPVYDADTMQQQYENANDYQQDENIQQNNTFVPSREHDAASRSSSPPMNLDQRLGRIEQQMGSIQDNDFISRVENLQNEIQTLRGQVEQLSFQLQQVKDLQKNMYSDLDKRLSRNVKDVSNYPKLAAKKTKSSLSQEMSDINNDDLDHSSLSAANKTDELNKDEKIKPQDQDSAEAENESKQTADTEKAEKNAQPDLAEEQRIYQIAYNKIKNKEYKEAAKTLEDMLQKYPSGQFASNAHYWLGELYGLMGNNTAALKEFTIVVTDYKNSSRISDAQLKIGLLYASDMKWSKAKTAFRSVIKKYPSSASARLAKEQLKEITHAGH